MSISDELKWGYGYLNENGIENPGLDCRVLISHAIGKDTTFTFAHPEYSLTANESEEYRSCIRRRAEHEPVAYITGHTEFYALDFFVNRDVLIPRDDTETLIDTVLERISDGEEYKSILDMCCGSGCIGITLAYRIPEASVVLCDVSQGAVDITKRNAKKLDVPDRTDVICSNLFEALSDRTFDLIVSNPPYVTEEEYKSLADDITRYEPKIAITAKDNGLFFYKKIASEAKKHLNSPGRIICEIGWEQYEDVKKIFEDNGFKDINIVKDLAGNDRVVTARV